MMQPSFPQKRDDGSVSVAARFAFAAPAAVDAAKATLQRWMSRCVAQGLALDKDLAEEPRIVIHDDHTFDVVFSGFAGSRWKDWMVYVTQEVVANVPEASFECFFDMIGNRAHPASLRT